MVGTPAWSSDQSVLGWAGTKKSCRPVVPEACSQDAWASLGTVSKADYWALPHAH